MRDASPAEPEVSGSLRDGTDRVLCEDGGDPTACGPPVSSHYSHITPHCGCTRTLLTAVCLWQGASAATADGENYMHGRRPTSSACTVAEDAAGDWLLPACVARASQAAWIAPAEPPASGEAQCADGEVREERGSAACSVLSLSERA